LVLGAILVRRGAAHVSALEGVSRAMPLTATLLLISALAASGAPLFASYTTITIALEAMAQWELQWAWALLACVPAGLFAALCLRLSLAAFDGVAQRTPIEEAPFPMLLSAALAAFFCFSVGVAPSWLYGLLPTTLEFAPFAIDRLAPHLALLGAAGVTLLAARALRLAPAEQHLRLRDVDALYRGPLAGAGRWLGVVLLRVYGTAQAFTERQAAELGRFVMRAVRACDRPYSGASGLASFAALITVAAVALVWRFL